jgi:hypothetical protein
MHSWNLIIYGTVLSFVQINVSLAHVYVDPQARSGHERLRDIPRRFRLGGLLEKAGAAFKVPFTRQSRAFSDRTTPRSFKNRKTGWNL